MKKIYMILAAAVLAAAAASCQKNEIAAPEVEQTPQSVKVNITVSSLTPDTKAIKTGWENGDKLNVYLEDAADFTPDFVLTFDGTNWTSSVFSVAVISRLKKTGGYLRGFWEASNSCMSSSDWDNGGPAVTFPDAVKDGTTGIVNYLVAEFNNISYTYDAGTLTANINAWRFRTNFQLVVTGLTYEAGRYTLFSNGIDNCNVIDTQTGSAPYECFTSYNGSGSTYGRIAGIPNADGVAFVGGIASETPTDYTFHLIDNTTGVDYTFSKTATLNSDSYTKVVAIKIPISKFYVDMGLSVKWGTHNLGATAPYPYFPTANTDDARHATWGEYYAWGETVPYYSDGLAYTASGGYGWKFDYPDGYVWNSYKFDDSVSHDGSSFSKYTGGGSSDYSVLQSVDDVAAATLGGDWRMPTYEEWKELLNDDGFGTLSLDGENCTWTWDATNLGYKVTSKKPGYTSQYIFLPAAGERHDTYLWSTYPGEEEGHYWSSTLSTPYYDGKQAYFISFKSTSVGGGTIHRYYGKSIRPVHP